MVVASKSKSRASAKESRLVCEIKQLVRESDLTLEQVACGMGISKQYLNNCMRSRRRFTPEMIKSFCRIVSREDRCVDLFVLSSLSEGVYELRLTSDQIDDPAIESALRIVTRVLFETMS